MSRESSAEPPTNTQRDGGDTFSDDNDEPLDISDTEDVDDAVPPFVFNRRTRTHI